VRSQAEGTTAPSARELAAAQRTIDKASVHQTQMRRFGLPFLLLRCLEADRAKRENMTATLGLKAADAGGLIAFETHRPGCRHGLQPIQKWDPTAALHMTIHLLFKMLKNDDTQLLEQSVDIGAGWKNQKAGFSTHRSMGRLADRLSVCRDDSAA